MRERICIALAAWAVSRGHYSYFSERHEHHYRLIKIWKYRLWLEHIEREWSFRWTG